MKKLVIFSLGIAAVLCGCYNEEPTQGSIEGAQEFVATTGDAARITIESGEVAPVLKWEEDDQVGIFDRTEDPKRNYCYDVNLVEGSNDCDLVANDASRVYYSVKGEASTYYAYAPYNAEVNAPACDFPISLPRVQTIAASGSVAHLKNVNFMMAQPLTIESGAANLHFESAFAFVRLDVSLAESASVPVKQVRIKSTSANLSAEKATIDLTTEGGNILVVEGSGEVVLAVEGGFNLTSTAPYSLYCMVLPGAHTAGTLTAEVVAVNNAVATVQLPAVEFKPNRYYTQSVTVSTANFVAAEEFKANEVTTGKAGEPVTFTFEGVADAIDLYTGEYGHDYLFKDTERILKDGIKFSFVSQYMSGTYLYDDIFRIKVSTNFSGTYTEAEIQKATWIDITNQFTLPDHISTASDWTDLTSSGEVDLSQYIPNSGSLYIGLFYHVLNVTEDPGGRTIVYLPYFYVNGYNDEETYVINNTVTEEFLNVVHGASFNSYLNTTNISQFKTNSYYPNCSKWFRFFSAFKPTEDLYAYLVTDPLTARVTNLGSDTPIVVQSETDAPQSSFSYTFAEPGTYKVVIVGHTKTITGEAHEIVKEFEIVIE